MKSLLTNEEEKIQDIVEKPKEKQMNLIDLVPRNDESETNISQTSGASQLKLLMEGKFIEPKKPEPVKNNVLKKKFKVNLDDLPTI